MRHILTENEYLKFRRKIRKLKEQVEAYELSGKNKVVIFQSRKSYTKMGFRYSEIDGTPVTHMKEGVIYSNQVFLPKNFEDILIEDIEEMNMILQRKNDQIDELETELSRIKGMFIIPSANKQDTKEAISHGFKNAIICTLLIIVIGMLFHIVTN